MKRLIIIATALSILAGQAYSQNNAVMEHSVISETISEVKFKVGLALIDLLL